jgi:sporulation protein YlmC with PRC-barrel domain
MRTIPTAVAALALLSATASAQTTPSRDYSTPTTTPRAATAPAPRPAAINPLTQEDISQIGGTAVYGSDDAKMGSISTILMDPKTKQIDRLVVSVGGVLGIGSHRVALPVDQFSWNGELGVFKLSKDLAGLKSMPAWIEGGSMTGSSTPTPATSPATRPAPAGAGNGASTDR